MRSEMDKGYVVGAGDRVRISIKDGVADVVLIRGEKMNALDQAMFDALIEAGEHLCQVPDLRAVVLSGEGKAFCAGLDMGRFQGMASAQGQSHELRLMPRVHGHANAPQHAVLVWRKIPVPVIAAVHGVALGGGFQLMLGADMRFIEAQTKLSIMEIKWGLVPDMGGVALMRRLMRSDQIRELTYSGRIFSGQEAHAMGLATRLCDDPRSEALAIAHEIALRSPDAIRAAKRLYALADDGASEAELLLAESREQVALLGSANQVESVRANLEKRKPVWCS
jgi:enoyl-CoA hydratase/carnithine racemase